jgi:hypothetical protein
MAREQIGGDNHDHPTVSRGNDLYLKADSFAEVYAGDLSPQQAKVLAAAHRPIDPKALGESFMESPTWRNVPTWVVVSTQDSSIPTEAQRSMAARARATMIEVAASHASPLSQAKAVRYEIAATESHESLVSRSTRSRHPFGERQLCERTTTIQPCCDYYRKMCSLPEMSFDH